MRPSHQHFAVQSMPGRRCSMQEGCPPTLNVLKLVWQTRYLLGAYSGYRTPAGGMQ